jgi:hypothetical protein
MIFLPLTDPNPTDSLGLVKVSQQIGASNRDYINNNNNNNNTLQPVSFNLMLST